MYKKGFYFSTLTIDMPISQTKRTTFIQIAIALKN